MHPMLFECFLAKQTCSYSSDQSLNSFIQGRRQSVYPGLLHDERIDMKLRKKWLSFCHATTSTRADFAGSSVDRL